MIKKIIGILIIFVGIGLFIALLTNIPDVIDAFSTALESKLNYDWGTFTGELLINMLLLILGYFIIRFGVRLYKRNNIDPLNIS